ncbi:hypothetical protein BU16DRAFT_236287 [Lophium mytilinum]|uniref:Uncharacterized protein n=1 Tax=Lophium mytilinum TaxID=390894 RepID=A0A6A6R5T2_9PEZI|nr:hypothetical protein BU16DRAFT_236287 [Lophium mytilinum]
MCSCNLVFGNAGVKDNCGSACGSKLLMCNACPDDMSMSNTRGFSVIFIILSLLNMTLVVRQPLAALRLGRTLLALVVEVVARVCKVWLQDALVTRCRHRGEHRSYQGVLCCNCHSRSPLGIVVVR